MQVNITIGKERYAIKYEEDPNGIIAHALWLVAVKSWLIAQQRYDDLFRYTVSGDPTIDEEAKRAGLSVEIV